MQRAPICLAARIDVRKLQVHVLAVGHDRRMRNFAVDHRGHARLGPERICMVFHPHVHFNVLRLTTLHCLDMHGVLNLGSLKRGKCVKRLVHCLVLP